MKKDDTPPPRTPIDAYETPLIPPPGRDLDAHIRFAIQFTPAERTRIFFSMMALHHLIGDALFAFLFDVLISERYLETVNDPPKGRYSTPRRRRILGHGRAAVSDLVTILPGLLYPNGKAPKRSTPLYSPTVLNILREVSRDPALFADALENIARAIRPKSRPGKGRRIRPLDALEREEAVLELEFIRARLKQARANPSGHMARNPHMRFGEALALGLGAKETAAVLTFARLHHVSAPLTDVDVDQALYYFDTARKGVERQRPKKTDGQITHFLPSTNATRPRRIAPSGAESANGAGRKRDTHNAEAHPQPPRPQQAQARRSAPRLPSSRPPAPRRNQPERTPEHDRGGDPPSRQARPRRPRPGG